MSDIGFDSLGQFIVNIVLVAILLVVIPAGIWVMARRGVRMPAWFLSVAKGLTVLFAIALFLVIVGLAAMFNKGR